MPRPRRRKPTLTVAAYADELVLFGGEPLPRAEVIRRLKAGGASDRCVNLWLFAYDRSAVARSFREMLAAAVAMQGGEGCSP